MQRFSEMKIACCTEHSRPPITKLQNAPQPPVQTWTKDALCSFGQPGYFGLKAPKTTEEGQVMYPHHPLGYQNH